MKERRLETFKVKWMRFFPGSLKNDDLFNINNKKKDLAERTGNDIDQRYEASKESQG